MNAKDILQSPPEIRPQGQKHKCKMILGIILLVVGTPFVHATLNGKTFLQRQTEKIMGMIYVD